MFIGCIFSWGLACALVTGLGLLIGLTLHALHGHATIRAITPIIFFPGCLVHEVGHAIACFLTGRKVEKMHVGTNNGFVQFDSRTGARTPLATFSISFAPMFSCGSCAVLLWHALGSAGLRWTDPMWILELYLFVAMAWGASPSYADLRVAWHSISERPRVTLVETASVGSSLCTVEALNMVGDVAFFTFIGVVVPTYLVLWTLFVYPRRDHEHGQMFSIQSLIPPSCGTPDQCTVAVQSTQGKSTNNVLLGVSRVQGFTLAGVKLSRYERRLLEGRAQ